MTPLEAVKAYFAAWNARDAAAILDCFAPDGTYTDPATDGPLAGAALRHYAEALWAAFPDLAFEIRSAAETGGGRVVAEWQMRGTNQGSYRGLPPTLRSVALAGADFIATAQGKVASVVGYFDPGALPRQLGLQTVVLPENAGPFRFGTSKAVSSGRAGVPGAFGVTQIEALDADAVKRIQELGNQIMLEMLQAPGFIGATTATQGLRMITTSAWDDEAALTASMRQGAHGAAVKAFFDGSLARSGFTSVWQSPRINRYLLRCDSCRRMNDADKTASCACGAPLPERPAYW
jgi:steroid delta-isomerase-like uncharacterized protein